MNKYILSIFLLIAGLLPASALQTQNYVYSSTRLTQGGMQNSYQYFDALGRPFERVDLSVTPTHSHLAWLTDYDALGRKSRIWHPGVVSTSYVAAETLYPSLRAVYSDSRPFAETVYETSPLDRPVAEKGAGQQWTNHFQSRDYLHNTESYPLSCKDYYVTLQGNLTENGLYPSHSLSVLRLTDEDGHQTLEFRNHQNQLVLSRRMLEDTLSSDTYYVYDRRGDLRYVLQPEYQHTENLGLYAFCYTYDGRHNVIEKTLPGAEPIRYGYDIKNQLIFSQDGVQREDGIASFMLYDLTGRLLAKGSCAEESWPEELSGQLVVASLSSDSEGIDGCGYETNIPLQNPEIEEAHYYDGYAFLDCAGFSTLNLSVGTINSTGLETGALSVSLVNGNDRYYTVNYYDAKGRKTRSVATNHLGGRETVETVYGYTEQPLSMKHTHTASGKATQEELYTYEYDHADRLKQVNYSLNGGPTIALKENTYDNYGRLSAQRLMESETVSFAYNIRNWQTNIRSTNFHEVLGYIGNEQYPSYNGSISRMTWKTAGESAYRTYNFRYDGLNRLTQASYIGDGDFSASYAYDLNGNPLQVRRNGLQGEGAYGQIDDLTYTYNGNQVRSVSDGVTASATDRFEFRDGASLGYEYLYDANGNQTRDMNKGISEIQYNRRNLPAAVMYSDSRNITYIYDAMGKKLRTTYKETPVTVSRQTDYCGNIIYEDGVLKRILIEGGYVTFNGTTPRYHYYLQDHLGNNRVVMSKEGTVEQVNHYYPGGGLFAESTNTGLQPYLYNGKELDRTYGLDWHDYGARHYDAARIQWTTMDPLSEKYYELSPYAMCGDNPINYIDINGLDWVRREHDGVVEYYYDRNVKSEKDVEDKEGVTYVGHGMTIRIGDETYTFYNDKESNKYGYVVNQFDMLLDNTKITSGNGYRIFGTSNHSVNAQTLYLNKWGTSYTGEKNPKDYSGIDSYQFPPQSGSEWGSYIHDLMYDAAHAKGPIDALFNNNPTVLAADAFLYQYNLLNALNSNVPMCDRAKSAGTSLAFYLIYQFKTSATFVLPLTIYTQIR